MTQYVNPRIVHLTIYVFMFLFGLIIGWNKDIIKKMYFKDHKRTIKRCK